MPYLPDDHTGRCLPEKSLPSEVYRAPHISGHHREVVVAPTTPRVTVRWRHGCAISPPRGGGRADKDDGSLRKKPWVSSLGGALLVLFSPRGEKSTPTPQESKENGGGSKPPPYGNGKTAAGSRKGTFAGPALRGTEERGRSAELGGRACTAVAPTVKYIPLQNSRRLTPTCGSNFKIFY